MSQATDKPVRAKVRTRQRLTTPTPHPMKSEGGDYEIGYRKPPSHSRFKPGQSGNPKGRPKGSSDLMAGVRAQLRKKITIRLDGRPVNVSLVEAVTRNLVHEALRGDTRSTGALLKLLELAAKFSPPEPSPDAPSTTAEAPQLGPEDLAFIERELERLGIKSDEAP